ncbi:armadillo-type protein [Baffinella frigidus]|nr:armadillo-type protein [Cryptophyta sp. CCMP2293]
MPVVEEPWVRAVRAKSGGRAQSKGRPRYALIVAVSEQSPQSRKNFKDLDNTDIDAAKLKAELLKMGWTVHMAVNLGLVQTKKKIKEFAGRYAKGDADCLFVFTGHGIEIDGKNFLVAADSKLDYESEAKFEEAVKRGCLPFDDVQVAFKNARGSSAGATVFLLDCCRSGFSKSVDKSAGSFTSRSADSSAIRPQFPNSIVIYSTTSGNVASDGERGEGGPFMGIFCEEVAKGAEVSTVMKRTRSRLLESDPDLCQLATDNSCLLEDFFFSAQREQQGSGGSSSATSPGHGDKALLELLREHNVADAAAWLHREGVTLRGDLLDVTEEHVQAAGLPTFVALRFLRMLEGLRDAAGGSGRASEAPVQVSLEGDEMETGVAGGGGVGPSENGVVQVLEASTDVAEIVAAMVGMEAVLEAMQAHGSSEGVQAHGCMVLGGLTLRNDDNKVAIREEGGIEAVLKAMDEHGSSADVQGRGCLALGNLAAGNAANRVAIAEKGGVKSVLKAMEAHGSSADVQRYGCWALARFACGNADNRVVIAAEGGITAVLKAMEEYVSTADVQLRGCFALGDLAAGSAGNQATIAEKGGVEAVLMAMDVHGSSADVQQCGCMAIGNLAWNNAASQVAIAEKGGIEALLDAMEAHGSSAGVQRCGCVALGKLAEGNDSNRAAILVTGGLKAVMKAMKEHGSSAEL